MSLNKHKKLEYIKQILQEVMNGSVNISEDSILVEVAIEFIDTLEEEPSDG